MIISHQSFVPTMAVLDNLYSRSKFEQIKICMSRPHLSGALRKYRFTIASYVDQGRHISINDLFTQIKQLEADASFVITHEVVPDPRFAPKVAVPVVEQPVDLISFPIEPVSPITTEPTAVIIDSAHEDCVAHDHQYCL